MTASRIPLPFLVCGVFLACAAPPAPPAPPAPVYADSVEQAERKADRERMQRLEQDVDRLRADLHDAEEALIAAESGLKTSTSRADAVSSLADARVRVVRATERAPWRPDEIEEARKKLLEAERQLAQGSYGVGLFFASRAVRIADMLVAEVEEAESTEGARHVRVQRANLRDGPSTAAPVIAVLILKTPVYTEKTEGRWLLIRTPRGRVGWMHASVLEED